jgi:hypothetical protein
MIKAAIKLADEDMGLAKILSYILYEYNPEDKLLRASVIKEVQIPLGPEAGEHEGKVMCARQKTAEEDVKVIHSVDGCLFLDMIGEYNQAGQLLTIQEGK